MLYPIVSKIVVHFCEARCVQFEVEIISIFIVIVCSFKIWWIFGTSGLIVSLRKWLIISIPRTSKGLSISTLLGAWKKPLDNLLVTLDKLTNIGVVAVDDNIRYMYMYTDNFNPWTTSIYFNCCMEHWVV